MKELIKYGKTLGIKSTKTKSGHLVFSGHGRRFITGSTPSDYRVIKSLRKNLTKIAQGKLIAKY